MPRTHLPYPPEFRQQIVELVRSGRAIREFDGSSSARTRPSAIERVRPISMRLGAVVAGRRWGFEAAKSQVARGAVLTMC